MINSLKWMLTLSLLLTVPSSSFAQSGDRDYQQGVKAFESHKYEEALRHFESAIKAYQKKKDTKGWANAHNYTGLTLQVLNQHKQAVSHFVKAADAFVKTDNKSGAASAFANLGISTLRVKQAQYRKNNKTVPDAELKAILTYHKKARKLHKELGDLEGVGDDYINIANMYIEAEYYENAIKYLMKALNLHTEIRYVGGLAYDLSNLGLIYYRLGINDTAVKFYKRGVEYFERIDDQQVLWQVYYNLGQIYQANNKPKTAVKYYKKSVAQIEGLTSNFTDQQIYDAFLRDKVPVYYRLIKLLKELGRTEEALEYIERSKAKLSNSVLTAEKIEAPDEQSQEKVDKIQELQAENEEIQKELAAEKAKPAEKQDKQKIDRLSQTLSKNQGDFNALLIDLETQYPNIYRVIKVDPIQLSDLQQYLSDDIVLLQYFPASDAIYIFLITRDQVIAKSVPVSQQTLDSLVQKFRYYMNETPSLVQRGRFDGSFANWTEGGSERRFYKRHLKPLRDILVQLHDYLILPVWETLKDDKIKNITFIPAGSLYYIPFQALATETNDGDLNFLIEKKSITYLTAATLMDLVSEKKRTPIKDVLLFGNPDGSLPGAEEEAKAIKASYTQASLYMNENATTEKAKQYAGQFDVVHFATHGYLSSEEPQKSFILMAPRGAEDDKLTLSEILKLPLKPRNELVVLSACNTAMGKNPTGVELISLSRAFAIAGAPTTVATLWPVDDYSTKQIMVRFYDGLKANRTKAEALQRAQVALLRSGDYHIHPFFWAPFVMIGNSK